MKGTSDVADEFDWMYYDFPAEYAEPEDVYSAISEELEAFAEWDALYAPQIGGEG